MSDARRPLWVDVTILILAGVMLAGMVMLGNWQVQRLGWKLHLIEQVETRPFGAPVTPPIDGDALEYLRVATSGTFDHAHSLRVKAVTEIGPGIWVLTPLQTPRQTVWINRGFVPTGTDTWDQPDGTVEVVGLIRVDQPGGTFLESNTPETGRWVSVDLTEMNRDRGLAGAQDAYFIDAEASGDGSWPRGGLTRLEFRNSHLVYALTWYAMAALFLGAMIYVIRDRFVGERAAQD